MRPTNLWIRLVRVVSRVFAFICVQQDCWRLNLNLLLFLDLSLRHTSAGCGMLFNQLQSTVRETVSQCLIPFGQG